MKKIFYLFFLLASLITTTTSCDGSEECHCTPINDNPNSELSRLYSSIDSLHQEYSVIGATRGFSDKWGRKFLSGTVDACVGVLTAETGPFGSFVCATIASGLYDDYFDYCVTRIAQCPRRISQSISSEPQAIVFNVDNSSFVDSIGYYHNLVLNEIQSKGVSFIDVDGEIDYNAFYKEVLATSKKYGILDSCTFNAPIVFKYINSIIRPLTQVEDIDKDACLSIIFNDTYNEWNYDNTTTTLLRDVCDKIILNDISVNDDCLIEYGTKVNDIIVNSTVPVSTKESLKIANNVAINSSLYWSSK